MPGLGTVSPLSATIWQGVAKRGSKPKGPLRLGIADEIIEQMEELFDKNPTLSQAQLLAHVIHEQDQDDVYQTLKKLGYDPASLDVVSRLEVFPHNTGYRRHWALVVKPLKAAKK